MNSASYNKLKPGDVLIAARPGLVPRLKVVEAKVDFAYVQADSPGMENTVFVMKRTRLCNKYNVVTEELGKFWEKGL